MQAAPFAPLMNFICDSYDSWLRGASDRQSSQNNSQRLKPELTILLGKVRRALMTTALSSDNTLDRSLSHSGAHRDLYSILEGADFDRRGVLDWPAFVRVLVEDLHLSIESTTRSDQLSSEERDLVARQVARSQAQRRDAAHSSTLTRTEKDEVSLNLAKDEELMMLRAYREGHKADVVRQRLQDSVTAEVDLYPRFGQVCRAYIFISRNLIFFYASHRLLNRTGVFFRLHNRESISIRGALCHPC